MPRPQARADEAPSDRLRAIESVIDARLARLDMETLLVELLDRVQEALDADTAAVLLHDEPSGDLVAAAARGIEEEVRQGVRVPLGRGFAGRIAAARQPVTIADLDRADVVNPILRERGIRSMLGVPLLAGDRLLGILHVGTLESRRFTEADVELLQVAAERVALATQARVSEVEREAVRVLQRSLLPDRLAALDGLESAYRYIAGGEGTVGGDWYDLFALPAGRVCVTIGDVVGRGLRSAVVMGRIRTAIRSYALEDHDPAAIVRRVDAMLQHFHPDEMATTAIGVIEPGQDRLHLTTAGHPAPVLATGPGPGTYLELPVDPPLGAARDARRRATSIDLPPGALVCFYTDGLIERRHVPLDERVDRLCETVDARPAQDVCARVMGALVGPESASDDVAVLVVRRAPAD
ncbi:MAG TPA: GAF domain-containing SpoIIE family protein phosphatase [Acidimicrobiales bacterium]